MTGTADDEGLASFPCHERRPRGLVWPESVELREFADLVHLHLGRFFAEFAPSPPEPDDELLAGVGHRADMAAKAAHVFRDLGVATEAERHARRSLEMADGYDRGRLFNTVLLATALADQRRVEEACVEGSRAVGMLQQVRSVRAVGYLTDLARRLAPFNTAPVRQLYRQMDDAGIDTPRM